MLLEFHNVVVEFADTATFVCCLQMLVALTWLLFDLVLLTRDVCVWLSKIFTR
jgi:hypothetical protein